MGAGQESGRKSESRNSKQMTMGKYQTAMGQLYLVVSSAMMART
jgi:hypothetical protein